MKVPTFEVLLVDPQALTDFLHSCAYTEVLAMDTKVITESTGLLWGLGARLGLPGGTAQRVGGSLSPNDRKALAVAGHAELLARYKELLDNPRGQAKFLSDLEIRRQKQRIQLDNLFAQASIANELSDMSLYIGGKTANSVQSVCCIGLAMLAPGGALVSAGRAAAIILGTKVFIATAQSERSWSDLAGFAIGTIKEGTIALGELSTKAFELIKDASIESSRNRMAMATAKYIGEMGDLARRIAAQQASVWATQKNLLLAKPQNAKFLEGLLKAQSAELQAMKGQMTQLGSQALGASKTGQFMKNFGGKAVPLVSIAIDSILEVQRWQEVDAQLEKGSYNAPRRPARTR